MKNYIQDHIIDEVRSRVDLVEVASEYMNLKRVGQNYKTLCPFHKENTPSFVINQDKGIFHCFGCGIGGNAFSFIMKMEKVGFLEAVKMLAKRYGVTIPSFTLKIEEEKEPLYKINECASEFFHDHLLSKEGEMALRYLMNRGLEKETIFAFKLGYAPDGWRRLCDFLLKKGFGLNDIERCGLIIQKEKGEGYYDRFRQRVIFPIFDIRGRVVGFGARILDRGEPKYLNSPETPIYTKGTILYGMNTAKEVIRNCREAIIVEGYMDVVLSHQYGFNNVVGSCGTALTQGHARLLKAYAKEVIILYDPDPAGIKASLRGVETLLEEGLGVKVVVLPMGYDPADLLTKKGKDAFKECISKSMDIFDHRLEIATSGVDLLSIDGKRKVIEDALPIIMMASDPIQRHTYIKKVAELLGIDEEIVRGEVKTRLKKKTPHVDIKDYLESNIKGLSKCERALISLILKDGGLLKEIKEEVFGEEFVDPVNKRIISLMKDLEEKDGIIDISKLVDFLDEEAERVASSLILEDCPRGDNLKLAKAYLKRMKEYRINRDIEALKMKIDHTDGDELKDLLTQYQNLVKEVRL